MSSYTLWRSERALHGGMIEAKRSTAVDHAIVLRAIMNEAAQTAGRIATHLDGFYEQV